MKHTVLKCIFIALINLANLYPISMVYNFRVAQITRQVTQRKGRSKRHTITTLLFDLFAKKENIVHQNFIGGFGSFIYNFKPYYFRTDFAVASLYETELTTIRASTVKTDDILFSSGRSIYINKQNDINISALFGVPTHKNATLRYTDFGYSQFGLGAQVDGNHDFSPTSAFVYGVRYIYLIPGTARSDTQERYSFTLGNISDTLIAYKKYWDVHGVEIGYSLKCCFGGKIFPALDDQIKKNNFIRSNFYAVYKYNFLINKLPSRLLLYSAYSLDHGPKQFGYERIVSIWASWSLSF